MHLPAALRRRILYATAATLLVSGLAYSARSTSPNPPTAQPAAATKATETLDVHRLADDQAVPALGKAAPPAPKAVAKARPKVDMYQVVANDTVGTIAEKFGLESTSILWANELDESDLLQIGQELKIPAVDGLVHTIESGDTLWGLAEAFDADFAKIVEANPDVDVEALQPGQILLVPGGQRIQRRLSTMVASRSGERTVSGSLGQWPLSGEITDWLGWRTHPVYGNSHYHDGIDIAVPVGTPVVAAGPGQVTFAGNLGGYGVTVKVDHGNGVVTLYAHLSQIDVEPGQAVKSGERIALSGNTGASTGPHLHFSVFVGGSAADPMAWLP